MNYYLFCYQSNSGLLSLNEAQQTIEQCDSSSLPAAVLSGLISKITNYNPDLVRSVINSPGFSQTTKKDTPGKNCQHTLLVASKGDHYVRINIYGNNVSIEMPVASQPALSRKNHPQLTA